MKRSMRLLPQISFSILIALSLKPRHGYEIMQQVEADSLGKIKLVPGALYSSIKNLCISGLIEEVPQQNGRRRYYQLTAKGREQLNAELEYFNVTLKLARQRNVFEGAE